MNIITAYSELDSERLAVEELKKQLAEFSARLLIVFASSHYDQTLLNVYLEKAFPAVEIIGCSTAGEAVSGHALQGSVVMMAFSEALLADFHVEVVENISQELNLSPAIAAFESHFAQPFKQIDYREYVGLVLIDGLSRMEEKLMENLGDKTNLIFIGGSAGDDLQFKQTHVYAKGKAYTNAAVLVLLKPKAGFDFIKTQSFSVSDRQLIPTKVEQETRTVLEFNGKPATQAYAEALGIELTELEAHFLRHPLGLMAEGEPFVRSPQRIQGSAVVFYCQIVENVPLMLLNPRDILEDTQAALLQKKAEMGEIQGVIDFNCILRTLQLRQEGRTSDYVRLFDEIPLIGFSTYGEAYLTHVNQTSTMLIFK